MYDAINRAPIFFKRERIRKRQWIAQLYYGFPVPKQGNAYSMGFSLGNKKIMFLENVLLFLDTIFRPFLHTQSSEALFCLGYQNYRQQRIALRHDVALEIYRLDQVYPIVQFIGWIRSNHLIQPILYRCRPFQNQNKSTITEYR